MSVINGIDRQQVVFHYIQKLHKTTENAQVQPQKQ